MIRDRELAQAMRNPIRCKCPTTLVGDRIRQPNERGTHCLWCGLQLPEERKMTETPTETVDKQKYRCNLICVCQQDVAYGYGETPLLARREAEFHFRDHHGAKTQYRQIVVEEAVPHEGGSHYELFAAGLRYEFTRGLGYEMYNLESLGDAYSKRDHSTHPFVFETNSPERAKALCEALRTIASDSSKNQKMRDAAKRALDEVTKISRAVW